MSSFAHFKIWELRFIPLKFCIFMISSFFTQLACDDCLLVFIFDINVRSG